MPIGERRGMRRIQPNVGLIVSKWLCNPFPPIRSVVHWRLRAKAFHLRFVSSCSVRKEHLSIYRALFTIDENQVRVLHVRWGGREFATSEELMED